MGAGAGVASLFLAPVLVGGGVMISTATGAGFVMGYGLSSGVAIAIGIGIAFGTGAIGGAADAGGRKKSVESETDSTGAGFYPSEYGAVHPP